MARITIDARKIRDLGIGTHIEGLLSELPQADPEGDYRVLVPDLQAFAGTERFNAVVCRSPNYSMRELFALPALLRREKAELFHSPHYVLPPRLPCPAVVTVHDLIHLRFPELLATGLHRFYAWWMLRSSTRNAQRVLTVSQHSKRDLIEMLGVPETKIRVVGNGVSPAFRRITDQAALDRVEGRYGLPKRFILCVGNINPHKNVARLLQAFEQVVRHEDLDLVLVGESVRRDEKVQAIRKAIALAGRVVHVPHVPREQLPALYSLAELFVIPSLYEGFGLTPLEAMACGTPVAAAHRASLPEVLGEAALWFDPEDVQDMAAKLAQLAGDAALREDLSIRGRQRAGLYSWQSVARQTVEAYREVLAEAG